MPTLISAQTVAQDDSYRTGKLKNGLTYYIRHNAKDPGLADFYIAQRVGSILEEPRQRGLAHFLEHMAFNGTKNFPGKDGKLGIVPWCETIGVKFGANLNAYTSIDQTVYNVLIPIVYQQIQNIANDGPLALSMDKMKKYLAKSYGQAITHDDYWDTIMYEKLRRGIDYHTSFLDILNSVTAHDVQQCAQDMLHANRRIEITQISE